MVRLTGLLLAALAAGTIVAGMVTSAVADVDPASDVLLQQDTFLPYQGQVCSQIKDALGKAAGRSKTAGYPLKVAVIASTTELGAAPQFFGHPSAYAEFLGRELGAYSTHIKGKPTGLPLLVVMPQGLAMWNAPTRVKQVAMHVAIPKNADANALTRVAVEAVPKLAVATGHPIPAVQVAGGCSHTNSVSNLLPFGIPILLLVVVGLLLRFRRPESRTEP